MRSTMATGKKGFTLVELAIVLVILGLLAGGVLAGKALVDAAELRGVQTEIKSYVAAIAAFREQYGALPGDLRNATDYWGAIDSTPATCRTLASTGTLTCNGDGDGKIHGVDATTVPEIWHLWVQLKNAGLISGSYSGKAGPDNSFDAVIGTNVPASRVPSGGYNVYWVGYTNSASATIYEGDYANLLELGIDGGAGYQVANMPLLSPAEQEAIDLKMDDGKPGKGAIRSYRTGGYVNTDCATSADPGLAVYNISLEGARCTLMMANSF